MLLFSRMSRVTLTSNDKQQIDFRLRAIISLSQEEMSKLFNYLRTYKHLISTEVNLSEYVNEMKCNLSVQNVMAH